MSLKFEIRETCGIIDPVFNETDYRYYLIGAFLRETRSSYGYLYTEMIEQAEHDQNNISTEVCSATLNSIDVQFYSNRIVITELYPEDEDNPQSTSLSFVEAKELLLSWQIALKEWHENKKEI
jgi:hypothetical protein